MSPNPHIAYLTGEFPRATDTFIQREVLGLRAAGFEVDTFAIRPTGSEHQVGPEQAAFRSTTTYVLDLARRPGLLIGDHLRALATSPRRYLGTLGLAWRTRRPGLRGSLFQLIYFVEAVVLAAELRRRGVGHLHNHLADSSCTVAMLASEVGGVPYSFTLHGPGIFFEAPQWQLGEKLDRAAFCSCISHFARSQAAVFCSPETVERLHIVHCGVEPSRLRVVEHRGPGTELCFIGRMIEYKGLGVLLEAMHRLAGSHPDLRLTAVGDGPDREALERRARSLGLADRVDFVGARSQDEVAGILGRTDVFVLPSFAEGLPVVLMEALGAGVPVVATNIAGVAELVEDDVTGYLVPPGDPAPLAEGIARLVDDADLRRRIGAAGRERVLAEFDSTREARRLGSLFTDHAAGRLGPIRPEVPAST